MAKKKREETYVDDGIFRDPVPRVLTADDWKEFQEAIARPYTETEWLADVSAFVDAQFAPELLYEASRKPDAPPELRDLMEIKRWLGCLTQTARQSPGQYSFVDVLHSFWLGCAYQRYPVRRKSPLVKKHQNQVAMLAVAREKTGINAEDNRRRCLAEMKKQKQQTRGSKVSHTQLQGRVATSLKIGLRTVKKYTPKNPKK